MEVDVVVHGDCLEILPTLPEKSVDMILCDLPYGKTAAKWDSIIPVDRLWKEYKRLIKPRGAIVLTAVQPFTSLLVTSNLKWYRHSWVWDKSRPSGFQSAKIRPMQRHEDILVFGQTAVSYNPIMMPRALPVRGAVTKQSDINPIKYLRDTRTRTYTTRYPVTIIRFPKDEEATQHIHPTQKPAALFDYLIRTYTQPGATILDNCSGSGTTAIAAYRAGRHFICMEKDVEYHRKSVERLERERGILLPSSHAMTSRTTIIQSRLFGENVA